MHSAHTYPWLSATGQKWKLGFEVVVGLYGYFAFLVAGLLGIAGVIWHRLWYVSLGLIVIYLLGGVVEGYLFYYSIKCPSCGHNPTRKKNGKWASPRYLEGKLKRLAACPACGAT